MADTPKPRKRVPRTGLGPTIAGAVHRIAEAARDAEESDGPHNIVGAVNVGGEGRVNAVQRQQVVRVRRRPDGTEETVTEIERTTHGDDT
jgi:hypothetical protein